MRSIVFEIFDFKLQKHPKKRLFWDIFFDMKIYIAFWPTPKNKRNYPNGENSRFFWEFLKFKVKYLKNYWSHWPIKIFGSTRDLVEPTKKFWVLCHSFSDLQARWAKNAFENWLQIGHIQFWLVFLCICKPWDSVSWKESPKQASYIKCNDLKIFSD